MCMCGPILLIELGNGLLVQDDVEVLDAVASFSDTKKKGLFGSSFFKEGLHA